MIEMMKKSSYSAYRNQQLFSPEDIEHFVDEGSDNESLNDNDFASRKLTGRTNQNIHHGNNKRWRRLLLVALVLLLVVLSLLLLLPQSLSFIRNKTLWLPGHYNRPTLWFRSDDESKNGQWKFKIVQITDIHLGEAEDTDWGPEQDRKTWSVIDSVLRKESPFDLIVLSGDQLTANNCKDNATEYYQLLGEFLTPYNVPWAMIFGNHDDADYEVPGTDRKIPTKTDRRRLLKVDASFPLSLSKEGPSYVKGITNYVLDVLVDDGEDGIDEKDDDTTTTNNNNNNNNIDGSSKVGAQIFFLDSGGGALSQTIDTSHLEWVRTQASVLPTVPAVAFQHIPTSEYVYSGGDVCQGYQGEGIAPLDYDAGILQTLANSSKRFLFLAVGHNHGNDYCCPYNPNTSATSSWNNHELEVCFGRHSGYGGYGNWERGSRVYELTLGKNSDSSSSSSSWWIEWKSWVRLESGEVIDELTR